jgi:hypothetical protein
MPWVTITKSDLKGKKMKAVFLSKDRKTKKTIHFGQANASDYTKSGDKDQRQRYLDRHRKNENWNNPQTAGALSRWILWGDSTSLNKNIASFKKRFGYK